jgi:cell division septation protein DedD
MKRISLILLCGLLLNALAVAQMRSSTTTGSGAQVVSETNTENSRTMVISTKSGEEIEVTVTNLTASEPPPSENAVIGEGGEGDPIRITIYNYVTPPGRSSTMTFPPEEMQPTWPPAGIPGVQPGTTYEIPPQPAPVYDIPTRPVPSFQPTPTYQVRPMRIIPGLPSPNSGRIYSLQIGSFAGPDAAAKTAQFIRNAGFHVVYERDGYNYRVVVPNVQAQMVHSTIQRLGALGIGEVWVRQH